MKMYMYRQGDVLLKSAKIPKDATLTPVSERLVLAYGEVKIIYLLNPVRGHYWPERRA